MEKIPISWDNYASSALLPGQINIVNLCQLINMDILKNGTAFVDNFLVKPWIF